MEIDEVKELTTEEDTVESPEQIMDAKEQERIVKAIKSAMQGVKELEQDIEEPLAEDSAVEGVEDKDIPQGQEDKYGL